MTFLSKLYGTGLYVEIRQKKEKIFCHYAPLENNQSTFVLQ